MRLEEPQSQMLQPRSTFKSVDRNKHILNDYTRKSNVGPFCMLVKLSGGSEPASTSMPLNSAFPKIITAKINSAITDSRKKVHSQKA